MYSPARLSWAVGLLLQAVAESLEALSGPFVSQESYDGRGAIFPPQKILFPVVEEIVSGFLKVAVYGAERLLLLSIRPTL